MSKEVDPMVGFAIVPIAALIFFICAILAVKCSENKANESPIWRIDYVGDNGEVKYSRYSSDLHYNRGVLNYKDFYDKTKVSTTETTKTVRIR